MNLLTSRFITKLVASTLFFITLSAHSADVYDEKTGQLSIPSVVVGTDTYKNVVIKVGDVLSIGSSESTFASDIYNSSKKQLNVSQVTAYGKRYYNVVITVAEILSLGTSSKNSFTGGVFCNIDQSGNQLLVYRHNLLSLNQTLPYNYKWTCDSTKDGRVLSANGVPNHSVMNGIFATAISAQSIAETLPLTPVIASEGESTGRGQSPGYAINGVKFDPGTAGTCLSSASSVRVGCDYAGGGGPWSMEALPGGVGGWVFDFGVDENNGHVQPNGQYHYHGMPNGLISQIGPTGAASITLVGWARDGFPIYARYGYKTPTEKNSGLKEIKSSYRLKSTPDIGRPNANLFPMGSFTQDWEYAADSGDLDKCNGRFAITPEFPNGIYHYYITDSYPFVQRCALGKASAALPGAPPPGAPPPGAPPPGAPPPGAPPPGAPPPA